MWVQCGKPEYAVRIDESLRDMFLQASVDSRQETRLTVVDIDEDALTEIGPWPWRRSQIADLVETLLSHYGVRAVALDVVLPEPADAEGDVRLAVLFRHMLRLHFRKCLTMRHVARH